MEDGHITPGGRPYIQPCNFHPAHCQSELFKMLTTINKNEKIKTKILGQSQFQVSTTGDIILKD